MQNARSTAAISRASEGYHFSHDALVTCKLPINIGGYLTRCYITANIHFSNSCSGRSDAFSTCFETSTLKITSISILQCCISLKFDMFNIQININEGNMLKLKQC
jgi:hypothetical protein